jgi:acetolactate synthase-1/2/3 large subunit
VPTHLIGNDAFQECDTVGITRPCTKHNYLVRDVEDLPRVLHEAFHIATTAGPARSWSTFPRTCSSPKAPILQAARRPAQDRPAHLKGDRAIKQPVEMMAAAKRPVFYTGGGVINSGRKPRSCCANWSR